MEQLNRIQIRGVVGGVKTQIINDRLMAKFTVATNYAYKNKEGVPVIETTWHNVTAFESKNNNGLDKIAKGSRIDVIGRLQIQKYEAADGMEKTFVDVLASKVMLLPDTDSFQYEF